MLATRSTLASDLFAKTSNQMAEEKEVQIIERVGEGLVDLIESGQINSPKMTELLRQYLLPMVAEGIDYLVLGCTHYPYLLPQIKAILPPHIEVIDSGYAVAKQTRNVLQQRDLLTKHTSQGRHTWLTSGKVEILKGFAPDFVEIRKIESRRAEVRN